MSDLTTPRNYHQPMCPPRVQSHTQAPTTRTRAGALTSPSCLDGGVSRVGPGQYPRPWLARKAVGSSHTDHASQHSTATDSESDSTLHQTSKSRMDAEPCRTHGNSHDDRDRTGGAQHARPRRGDRHPLAAGPDADPATDRRMSSSYASGDGVHEADSTVHEEKEMINDANALLSVVTTGKARFHSGQDL